MISSCLCVSHHCRRIVIDNKFTAPCPARPVCLHCGYAKNKNKKKKQKKYQKTKKYVHRRDRSFRPKVDIAGARECLVTQSSHKSIFLINNSFGTDKSLRNDAFFLLPLPFANFVGLGLGVGPLRMRSLELRVAPHATPTCRASERSEQK